MDKEPRVPLSEFEKKKRAYFGGFARARMSHLQMHKQHGVLNKAEGWRNVSEHCLLESVIADILAEKLKLRSEEREIIVNGALLHDFFKKEQMRILREESAGREGLDKSETKSNETLKAAGYSQEVATITNAAGDVRRMALEYAATSFLERLMFYIDNIVSNTNLSTIDTRINAFQASGKYKQIDEEDREIFGGVTHLETQRRVAKAIQKEIAQKLGIPDPETLPEWIEAEIKQRIEAAK